MDGMYRIKNKKRMDWLDFVVKLSINVVLRKSEIFFIDWKVVRSVCFAASLKILLLITDEKVSFFPETKKAV